MRKASVTVVVVFVLILCLSGCTGKTGSSGYTVNVAVLPADAGTVSGGGSFASGYTATLTAAPAAGYEFSGWSGDASGSYNPLEIAVTSDLDITAEFVRLFSVEAEVLPAGAGSVTGCAVVRAGRPVTLTALPADGYYFSGWSGAISGTSNPFSLSVTADLSITAEFKNGGRWTWMSGSDQPDQPAVYGTRGVANAANQPGGRGGHSLWADADGRAWVFGGYGSLNDLWRFDPAAAGWAWVAGSDAADASATYGTIGVPNPFNTPGGRRAAWSGADGAGNLWLFGGEGRGTLGKFGVDFGFLADLWKFDPALDQWAWMAGPTAVSAFGVYGTIAVPNPANHPGARNYPCGGVDPQGNLGVFGGGGYADTQSDGGGLSDLWKFDPLARQWCWMAGPKAANQYGQLGTIGVSNPANYPISRDLGCATVDPSGVFWLFGGIQITGGGYAPHLGDLWRFDPSTMEWTFMGKGADPGQPTPMVHGTRGVTTPGCWPGVRCLSAFWADGAGNLWLFGGCGECGDMGDLWKYDTGRGLWTWMAGPAGPFPLPVFGEKGVSSPSNRPGGRVCLVSGADPDGNLWIFDGGVVAGSPTTQALRGDLWCFTP